jgi:hypothetical protein
MLHHMYGEMRRCTFYNNTAPEGALQVMYRNPLIAECTFYGNSGSDCAALRTWSSSSEITQCTFADNSSSAGSVWLTGGSPQPDFNSSIIAFNTNSVAVACTDSLPELACCDIYGNDLGDWVGCIAGEFGNDGNIRMDPLFCDPDSGDYTLQLESPCMADSAPPGCPRLGAHDVGCSGGAGAPASWPGETLFLSQPSPNPASAGVRVSFALPAGSESDRTRVRVFDVTGRLVRALVDGKVPGGHIQEATWDGLDHRGKPVSSGIYYIRLESGREGRTVKVVFAR